MESFFTNPIKHIPDKPISDYIYLGYTVDSYDVYLVWEENEFRIYNYEYWSYDSIIDWEHENEDWYENISRYFVSACGDYLDLGSLEYIVPKFEGKDAIDIASEIVNVWEEELDVNTCMEYWAPIDRLVNFIDTHLNGLVYAYYK